jgi:hypothetical protein
VYWSEAAGPPQYIYIVYGNGTYGKPANFLLFAASETGNLSLFSLVGKQ